MHAAPRLCAPLPDADCSARATEQEGRASRVTQHISHHLTHLPNEASASRFSLLCVMHRAESCVDEAGLRQPPVWVAGLTHASVVTIPITRENTQLRAPGPRDGSCLLKPEQALLLRRTRLLGDQLWRADAGARIVAVCYTQAGGR